MQSDRGLSVNTPLMTARASIQEMQESYLVNDKSAKIDYFKLLPDEIRMEIFLSIKLPRDLYSLALTSPENYKIISSVDYFVFHKKLGEIGALSNQLDEYELSPFEHFQLRCECCVATFCVMPGAAGTSAISYVAIKELSATITTAEGCKIASLTAASTCCIGSTLLLAGWSLYTCSKMGISLFMPPRLNNQIEEHQEQARKTFEGKWQKHFF